MFEEVGRAKGGSREAVNNDNNNKTKRMMKWDCDPNLQRLSQSGLLFDGDMSLPEGWDTFYI